MDAFINFTCFEFVNAAFHLRFLLFTSVNGGNRGVTVNCEIELYKYNELTIAFISWSEKGKSRMGVLCL